MKGERVPLDSVHFSEQDLAINHPFVTGLRDKITSHILNSPEMNRGFEFRMSMAGDCQRKMDYDLQLGKPKVEIDTAHRLLTGEPIHDYWRKLLEKVLPNDYMFAEDELELTFEVDGETIVVKGHMDGFIESLNAIVEVKSVGMTTFRLVAETNKWPLPAHYEQGNMYAETKGASQILYIYHHRDSGAYQCFLVPHSAQMAQATVAKWASVIQNKKKGVISDRPYHDASGSPCSYCHWRDKCYEGFAGEVQRFKPQTTSDPTLKDIAVQYLATRRSRLEQEKSETQFKSELAEFLFEKQLNSLVIEGIGEVTMKVGRHNNPIINIKETNGKSQI